MQTAIMDSLITWSIVTCARSRFSLRISVILVSLLTLKNLEIFRIHFVIASLFLIHIIHHSLLTSCFAKSARTVINLAIVE